MIRLEAALYPSAGLLRFDTDEARFRCQDIAESLEAMADGIELCPLDETDEPLDRLETSLIRGIDLLAAHASR